MTHQGYSVQITTCQTCKAVQTIRNTPNTTPTKGRTT